MKNRTNVIAMAKSRKKQAVRVMVFMTEIMGKQVDEITDANMADLRDYASNLAQYVHEFNALRNVLDLNEADAI